MKQWRLWALMLGIVTVLILPVLVLGLTFEERILAWAVEDRTEIIQFFLIAGVLALDLVLPVPSSALSTYAGGALGFLIGTCASWLGMTAGAVAGFATSRLLGLQFVRRRAGDDETLLANFSSGYGMSALLITRPLPLLAEACVLLAGASRMRWTMFLVPVATSNLVISICYAAAGAYSRELSVLPQTMIAVVLLPITLTVLVRRAGRRLMTAPPAKSVTRPESDTAAPAQPRDSLETGRMNEETEVSDDLPRETSS